MPSLFFNAANVDFDDLFEPDPAGVTVPGFYAADGVTLLRYAGIVNGTKIPDVLHFDESGSDVTNYWAGKGTVSYVTSVSGTVRANWTQPVAALTRCSLTLNRNGTWQMFGTASQLNGNDYPTAPADTESGTWFPNAPSTIGDDYDVRFTWILVEDTGGWSKTVSNGAVDWMQLNVGRNITTTVSGQPSSNVVRYSITTYIRRRSTGQVVSTGTSAFIHSIVFL